jgi:hypothetical protein
MREKIQGGRTVVQVDVFWTYALGAGFAATAGRQIREAQKDAVSPFQMPYFLRTLLFLSILFVPSGVCLLWAFPGWETMFAGDRNLPAWLVTLFCMTNITQGILGYWVACKLIEKGHLYWAHLQWVLGYLAMFFILVHGWDGTGWHRFFYAGNIEQWRAGVHYPLWAFAYSKVALTLYLFGVFLLPVMFNWMSSWLLEGYRLANVDKEKAREASKRSIIRHIAKVIFLYTLGSAIVASLLVHLLGWVWGLIVFFVVFYVAGIRKGGLLYRQIYSLTLEPEEYPFAATEVYTPGVPK